MFHLSTFNIKSVKLLHFLNKRPTGLHGHLSISDFTLTSCQKDSYCISTANKNQQWHGSPNTIAINALYIDREEDNEMLIHYNDLHVFTIMTYMYSLL